MDPIFYKDTTVSRGLKYHYYFSAAQDSKPTLLLIHGFPNTSVDWRRQVPFFKNEGYGLIVPDMLGYGGTAKPEDTAAYAPARCAQDVVDILDAEKVERVLAIGHDWGSAVISRLSDNFHDRFLGFAFLSVGYVAPRAKNDHREMLEVTKKAFGYELFGYWDFFSEPDASQVIEAHLDSALSLLYCKDSAIWAKDMAGLGAMKAWLLEDKTTERGDYISEEEVDAQKKLFLENGFASPLNWYKVYTGGHDVTADKGTPADFIIKRPVFLGATDKDYICLSAIGEQTTRAHTDPESLTIRHYETGHWVLFEGTDTLNKDLLAWINGLKL